MNVPELANLLAEYAACTICKGKDSGIADPLGHYVLPQTCAEPLLIVIGQSPGSTEVMQRRPFVGPAGQLLDQLLEAAGVSRERCWITNAVKCNPPRNRPLLDLEVRNCAPKLEREFIAVEAPALLILGKDAWSSIDEIRERIPFRHGFQLMNTVPRLLVSRHPSYFLRNGAGAEFTALAPKLREVVHGPVALSS